MRTPKDVGKIVLLFLLPAALLALPLRTAVSIFVTEKRTQALVTYIQKNQCYDSSPNCYKEEIHWLINNGANVNAIMPNGEPLMRWCAKRGGETDLNIVQHLQAAGAILDEQTQRILSRIDQKKRNDQLLQSVMDGLPAVRQAIAAGADVNYRDEDNGTSGDTPLEKAVAESDIPVIKFLISRGADVRHKNLLPFALRHSGDAQVISVLKAAGAPTNPALELTLAVIQKRPKDVQKLLRPGVNINITDKVANDNWTVLMWAADYHHTDMVRLLLVLGANPHLKGNNYSGEAKWTALRCAEQSMGDWVERAKTIEVLKNAKGKDPVVTVR